jgi:hypothetical protein
MIDAMKSGIKMGKRLWIYIILLGTAAYVIPAGNHTGTSAVGVNQCAGAAGIIGIRGHLNDA